jgi:tetratricopeptide (TPR) repeat protein
MKQLLLSFACGFAVILAFSTSSPAQTDSADPSPPNQPADALLASKSPAVDVMSGAGRSATDETVAPSDDDWKYDTAISQELVRKARQFDPLYCRPEMRDRDQAVSLYQQAIEAQPGANLNAAIADRIAQLYAFYANKEQGVSPDPIRAAEWWERCLQSTDSTQLLYAQAHAGLASSAVMLRRLEESLEHYDEILKLDPDSVQLATWKSSTFSTPSPWHEAELRTTRQRLCELQSTVQSKRESIKKISLARTLRDQPVPEQSNQFGRVLQFNLIAVVILLAVIWFRSRRSTRH